LVLYLVGLHTACSGKSKIGSKSKKFFFIKLTFSLISKLYIFISKKFLADKIYTLTDNEKVNFYEEKLFALLSYLLLPEQAVCKPTNNKTTVKTQDFNLITKL